MMNVSTLHRLRRVTNLMKANAELATRGRWWMSHRHVLARDRKSQPFDVACEPWLKAQTVYGVNQYSGGDANMRHIATCYPDAVIQLVGDVEALLEERDQIIEQCAAVAEGLPQLIQPTAKREEYIDVIAAALGGKVTQRENANRMVRLLNEAGFIIALPGDQISGVAIAAKLRAQIPSEDNAPPEDEPEVAYPNA